MSDISLSCKCGTLSGVLRDVSPKVGSRVVCYCKDCQAGAHALGAEFVLNDRGGTDIFQSIPSVIDIQQGQEHLACLRLSPKGLMRWYAGCCDTPLFNTLATPKLTFSGIVTANLSGETEALGPVIAVNKGECATPGDAIRSFGFLNAGWQIIKRNLAAKLRGDRKTPFFTDDGAPVVSPRVLTLDERKAATPE